MATLSPITLNADQLAPALRAWANGLYTTEAAVELLIGHRTWLLRGDFLSAAVAVVDDGWTSNGPTLMASIDWDAALALLEEVGASTSEGNMLRVAASLADGTQEARPLAATVVGLDATNVGLVLDAVAHLAGWHEQRASRDVTGHFGGRR